MSPQENENKTWLEVIFEPPDQGQAVAGRSTGVRNSRPESFTGQREVFEGHGAAGGENAPKDTKRCCGTARGGPAKGWRFEWGCGTSMQWGEAMSNRDLCSCTKQVHDKFYNDSAGLIPAWLPGLHSWLWKPKTCWWLGSSSQRRKSSMEATNYDHYSYIYIYSYIIWFCLTHMYCMYDENIFSHILPYIDTSIYLHIHMHIIMYTYIAISNIIPTNFSNLKCRGSRVGLAGSDQGIPRILIDQRDQIVTRHHVQQALLEVLQPGGGWLWAGFNGGSCHGYGE